MSCLCFGSAYAGVAKLAVLMRHGGMRRRMECSLVAAFVWSKAAAVSVSFGARSCVLCIQE